ncbi:uncharacterized protein LOC103716330 isoform X2 [Phoenix dactylifera]|uniref:Uncharacterized protein LOC103716330 isoform X2 n=1 Tax=Phoenix dactylifera TaxID=42345 RepID=A0A8B8ZJL1_PHODC|nr:uncharacterized protein LOC103716330 isoform X2 [Phoenix dactylifera]
MARGRRRRRHPKLGLLLLFSVNTRERSLARVLGRPRPRPAAPAVAGPSHGGDARELLLADESNWLSEQSLLLIDSPIVEDQVGKERRKATPPFISNEPANSWQVDSFNEAMTAPFYAIFTFKTFLIKISVLTGRSMWTIRKSFAVYWYWAV